MEYLKMKEALSGRTKEEKIQKESGEKYRTHVMRYGTILTDDSQENEHGSHRHLTVYINKMIADIKMTNGHVRDWGISSFNFFKVENLNDRLSAEGKQIRLIHE